ncbi:MAG: S-layer homology domain-containing protein [Oscillospiraceae bacterium]|nr:S-layer homology domain-containing protein [Oscillospiraceae bacterium]
MKKLVSLLLAAILLLSLCGTVFASEMKLPVYGDVAAGSWYENYVNQMVAAGLMNGVSAEKFDPNGTLSRAMFVTILYRAAGKPATGKASTFADVAKGSWYADGVDWAANGGVVGGYNATTFAPNDSLTREQMVTILYRWSGAEKTDAAALDAFPDKAEVSSYAVDAFAWAVKNNVIGGKNGKLVPKGTTTRAEACAVLARYLETVAPTRENLEKAISTAAWAYFAKVGKLQYCSAELTKGFNKYFGGQYRLTENAAPEYGTTDTTIYSVCSDYCYKTYVSAIGYHLFDSPDYLDATTTAFWQFGDQYGATVARYKSDKYELSEGDKASGLANVPYMTLDEMKAFLRDWEKNLRPGDILVPTGHAILYVGNGMTLDCGGSKYTRDTGVELAEPRGAVWHSAKVTDIFLDGTDTVKFNKTYVLDNIEWLIVLRPTNILVQDDGDGNPANDKVKNPAFTIPASTFTREQNPLMDIDRTVSITPYGTAYTGEELTYSVKISNLSDHEEYTKSVTDGKTDFKALAVTEKIPAGTELVPGSITGGGTVENGVISWTVDVPAGETKTVSYKVKVTAKQGETITATGGWVNDIPSNTITNKVGGTKLSAEAVAGLQKLADTPVEAWREQYNISANATDLEFAERVYAKACGVELELPTVKEIVNGLMQFKQFSFSSLSRREPYVSRGKVSGKAFALRDKPGEAAAAVADMIVPGYIGGASTMLDHSTQINEFHLSYLEPGDILVYVLTSENGAVGETRISVATGDNRLLSLRSDKKLGVADNQYFTDEVMWKAYYYDIFFLLRPSLSVDVTKPYNGTEPNYGEEPVISAGGIKSAPLSEENKAKFTVLAQSGTAWDGKNTSFAENVYKLAGLDLAKLTEQKTIVTLMKTIMRNGRGDSDESNYLYTPIFDPTEETQKLTALLVDGYRGGPDMAKTGDTIESPTFAQLEIGDVLFLVKRSNSTYWCGVKLSDTQMILATYSKSVSLEYQLRDFGGEQGEAEFAKLLKNNTKNGDAWEYYIAMRPSQAFADINTGKLP